MQYTLRDVPGKVDRALRAKARADGVSLNKATLSLLEDGLGLSERPMKRRDLSDIAGLWKPDKRLDRTLEDQRAIDTDLWR